MKGAQNGAVRGPFSPSTWTMARKNFAALVQRLKHFVGRDDDGIGVDVAAFDFDVAALARVRDRGDIPAALLAAHVFENRCLRSASMTAFIAQLDALARFGSASYSGGFGLGDRGQQPLRNDQRQPERTGGLLEDLKLATSSSPALGQSCFQLVSPFASVVGLHARLFARLHWRRPARWRGVTSS